MQYPWLFVLVSASAVAARDAHGVQQPAGPCVQLESAARSSPDDVNATIRLAHCTIRDEEMVAPDGDSTRLAFRTAWGPALKALRRAVQASPAEGRAYQPLFRMLLAETRDGCSHATGLCLHVASVIRDGDSLITVPRRVPEDVVGDQYADVVRATAERQAPSLNEAIMLAERWASAAPNDYRPYHYRGQALLRLGNFVEAAQALERSAALTTPESRRRLFWDRFEALVKANRGADARLVLEEAIVDPGRDTTMLRETMIASLDAVVGRFRMPPVDAARLRQARARVDSIVRSRPPAPRAEASFPELIAAGDTAGARRMLARIEAMVAVPPGTRRIPRYDLVHLQIAQYHLALGDTAVAESLLVDIDRPFGERPFQFKISFAYSTGPWLGRAWVTMGDVAAARGRPEEARGMYRRVVGLWGGGDPDLHVIVDDARSKLDAISRR